VICNDNLCNRLIKYNQSIKAIKEAHLQEHCLEVQIPYLQTVLPEAQIVPVIMGYPDNKTIDILTEALFSAVKDDNVIMIASTDWQHYRPASEGWVKDSLGLDCLKRVDPDKLNEYLQDGKVEMCGGGITVAVLRAAMMLGADKVKILKYGDSGDITGDKSSVVSYTAAAIYKSTTNPDKANKIEKNDNINYPMKIKSNFWKLPVSR